MSFGTPSFGTGTGGLKLFESPNVNRLRSYIYFYEADIFSLAMRDIEAQWGHSRISMTKRKFRLRVFYETWIGGVSKSALLCRVPNFWATNKSVSRKI